MLRHQAIKLILGFVSKEIIVSNIGDPSKEVYHIKDRPKNFYMLGSLGLASSISLGLALSQKKRVICLDGDGSILSNLGTLATIANHNPENLIIIVLDNGVYGTTGNQKSFTSDNVNLFEIANSLGFTSCYNVSTENELVSVIRECLENASLSFIHVNIKPDIIKFSPISLNPIEIKRRFMSEISKN